MRVRQSNLLKTFFCLIILSVFPAITAMSQDKMSGTLFFDDGSEVRFSEFLHFVTSDYPSPNLRYRRTSLQILFENTIRETHFMHFKAIHIISFSSNAPIPRTELRLKTRTGYEITSPFYDIVGFEVKIFNEITRMLKTEIYFVDNNYSKTKGGPVKKIIFD